ncbi:MBL fold metallo-hydrolase [Streptomyces sp. HU2014]|uniref:Alkyl/aryl-sulfatase n=1 Tax=Streptomyces albireticuli TaxID=1940 RepID=A0A1Z2LCA6_9ACTN|nr:MULTISPECIES: alkyl sulfatase dimerization domain-containing protein [Streptomyces]ARZ71841.1 alkyl/aryl-sulfatase [Streptomyces albireticuli]UQI45264.1 MBL fold metallo-hydrolase [Streptomyces sp. HU2014]
MTDTRGFTEPVEPSPSVVEANRGIIDTIPPNAEDFQDAQRGLLALPGVPVIPTRDNKGVAWNFAGYDFLLDSDDQAPPSVNASLWRQGKLTAVAGLFQVTAAGNRAIYQVRGYDLSNMTIVTGDTGIVVIDPLASYETAQHALKLYRDTTEDSRPISAVIYTHSHVDHFGGSRGLFHETGDVIPKDLPVYAPEGFLDHAISENVYAGPAMARRAEYMYAAGLDKSPYGQVGSGLGLTISTGEVTLVPPTHYVGGPLIQPAKHADWLPTNVVQWREGLYQHTIDGIPMVFQLTPGTECPAEMNFYFPELRTMCMAENSTHTLHNILSLRGAQVRDPHAWSTYLTEAIQTFGEYTDVEFASHHWPRWGSENIVEFLSNQRDMYAYLNDQTLRLIDEGFNGIEIAEKLRHLPPGLAEHWYNQGYYGSLSHNFKAVYQRYIGWFDGNPAHLWNLPPVQAGVNYVRAMGGPAEVVRIAREAYQAEPPQYRWAVELLNHVIFASGEAGDVFEVPADVLQDAKNLQAEAMTQLGYGAENGTWRNFFLTGAEELRNGPQKPTSHGASDLVRSMTLDQFFTAMAKSVDGPKAAREQRSPLVLRWVLTGTGQECTTTLRNGVLIHVDGQDKLAGKPQATISLTREALNDLALAGIRFKENFDAAVAGGHIQVDDQAAADTVFGYLTFPDPVFPLVTPRPVPSDQEPGPVTG